MRHLINVPLLKVPSLQLKQPRKMFETRPVPTGHSGVVIDDGRIVHFAAPGESENSPSALLQGSQIFPSVPVAAAASIPRHIPSRQKELLGQGSHDKPVAR